MRKLISVSATSSSMNDGKVNIETLYGVADDGTVWAYTITRGSGTMPRQPNWQQLPDLPQSGVHMAPPR